MKLGIFGARGDQRGLHYQTQSYAKWLEPRRVLGLDLTQDNLSPYECDWSGYRNVEVLRLSELTEKNVRRWLKGLDVVFGAETFYKDEFPDWARSEGVKTVLHINPEFTPYFTPQGKTLPRPDVLLTPSTWRMNELPGAIHLPMPVDRYEFPFKLRTHAKKFVHVAGHKAMGDRAGTRILMTTLPLIRNSLDVTILSQSQLGFSSPIFRWAKVVENNFPHPRDLYEQADIVILPRRYGGLSLVAQEALSSGCPVIMLDREPESTWGGVWPVRSRARQHLRTKAGIIVANECSPSDLSHVLQMAHTHPEKVEELSYAANDYAHSISWDMMLPRYHDVLCR